MCRICESHGKEIISNMSFHQLFEQSQKYTTDGDAWNTIKFYVKLFDGGSPKDVILKNTVKIVKFIKNGIQDTCAYHDVFTDFDPTDVSSELRRVYKFVQGGESAIFAGASVDMFEVYRMIKNKQFQYFEGVAQLLDYIANCDINLNEDILDDMDEELYECFPKGYEPKLSFISDALRYLKSLNPPASQDEDDEDYEDSDVE